MDLVTWLQTHAESIVIGFMFVLFGSITNKLEAEIKDLKGRIYWLESEARSRGSPTQHRKL